jgi:purine-binding chemotaxis protein CheW
MDREGQRPARPQALLVRGGDRLCAIPLDHVVETMRPLPTASLDGAPPFVLGVSVVRGEPVPVVDLARALAGDGAGASARYVLVRAGGRRFALAVSEVSGVVALDPGESRALPLLADACGAALAEVTTRDEELLLVLRPARLVPPEAWSAIAARNDTP